MVTVDSILVEMEAMLRCDVADLDATGVVHQARRLRSLRGVIDARDAALAARTTAMYEAGEGAPASDVITRNQNVSSAEAKRRERRGKVLAKTEAFADALSTGTVTAEHADALANATAKLDHAVADEFFAREAELLASATTETPERFARHCRNLANQLTRDHGVARNQRQRRETRISRKIDTEGMYQLHGSFHPELGAAIWSAIDTGIHRLATEGSDKSTGSDPSADQLDRAQLGAQAVAELILGGHEQTRPIEAEVIVIADVVTATTGELHDQSICETDHGVDLPPSTVQRLMCNGRVTPIVVDTHGVVINVGRGKRLANRAQRRALRAMYRTCAFAGCDASFARCEIHHIQPWELGGNTDLTNLLPLCSRHHHVVHELGWRLELRPDRTLTITDAHGVVFATCPLERPKAVAPVPEPARPARHESPPTTTPPPIGSPPSPIDRHRRRPTDQTQQLLLPA